MVGFFFFLGVGVVGSPCCLFGEWVCVGCAFEVFCVVFLGGV